MKPLFWVFLMYGYQLLGQSNAVSGLQLHTPGKRDSLFFAPLFSFPDHSNAGFSYVPAPKPSKVPMVYSYHDLAPFCKIEVQLERKLKFPFKFRLGEVQYTERLEGKR